jgi:predicted naringenin-chalcone synthase
LPYIHSIGLAKAPFCHQQSDIFDFITNQYVIPKGDYDKIKRLYERSEIDTRYAAIKDFSSPKSDWTFFSKDGNTSLEKRMETYFKIAPNLCLEAIKNCIPNQDELKNITHLITVSCTGLSAPGLDIQLMQLLNLKNNIHRTSINFMGCYAAIHALKQANDICKANPKANVLIVDIELCTLHFQDTYSMDNIAASLLFADGAAAFLINNTKGLYSIEKFYSEVAFHGYNDMAWTLSSTGFLMTLSGYIPAIIAENIEPLLNNALLEMNITKEEIKHWAIHPGGKKILNEIVKALSLNACDLNVSRTILKENGNMSSATLLFVLDKMQIQIKKENEPVFCAAFGPGLTIETMFLKTC